MTETLAKLALRRDGAILITGAAAITLVSWFYMARMAAAMSHQAAGHHMHGANAAGFGMTFVMWTMMMIAMMLPAVSPFVLAFASVGRAQSPQSGPYVPSGVFLSGYFFVWTAFSAGAALAQQYLHRAALLSPAMTATTPIFAGCLLAAAGIYQWTPLKEACLHHCRSPLGFLLGEWREGARGAFVMGVEHGLFCLGCCWFLMALPFAGGVMNMTWMAAITVFILIEKACPGGEWVGRVAGAALLASGGWMLISAIR